VAGAFEFFDRLPDPKNVVERGVAHYLATHPLSDERIEVLRERARAAGWPLAGELSRFEVAGDVGEIPATQPGSADGAER
jgi:predicted Zn-dependent protease